MPTPIPLAIGLIKTHPNASPAERSQVRVKMGAFAFSEGYALAETFEITGRLVRDDAALAAMNQLASRCSVKVLLAADDVPAVHVEAVRRKGLFAVMLVPSAKVSADRLRRRRPGEKRSPTHDRS